MILVVDAHPDAGTALCRLLAGRGYPSEWVGTGLEALDFIRTYPRQQPLLIVLDEIVLRRPGIDLLAIVQEDPDISSRPVIIHSDDCALERRAAALAMGAVAWVPKGGGRDVD